MAAGETPSRRVGFIIGKTCDAVEDPLFKGDRTVLRGLPDRLRVNRKKKRYLKYCEPGDSGVAHVDVAIAWYIQDHASDLEVDIIEPGELSHERLSANVCNFILGWDLIDAALEGPERLRAMTDAFRACGNLVPQLEVQEFIYYKSRYLKACMAAGVPTAPTIFVSRGEQSGRLLLQKIKARGWKAFVIKKSFNCWSLGFVRYSVEACEKSPEALDRYFQTHAECPEFIVQEALTGFARHWETRVFWWGNTFIYAVANKSAVATGAEEVIVTGKDIPEDFLENAKRIGRQALCVLPAAQTPGGHTVPMTLVRTDVGCSDGKIDDLETRWDPARKTWFLNEIEYGGTNYFARHLPFDCVPLWGEKYSEKAREIMEKDGPAKPRTPVPREPVPVVPVPPQPLEHLSPLHTAAAWLAHADALLIGSGVGMCTDAPLCTEFCDASWLNMEPRCAWAFWSGCYGRLGGPHAGYEIVKSMASRVSCGSFCVSSALDGHWPRSGWPENQLLELRGSVRWLCCFWACCDEVWRAPQALDPMPRCPRCSRAARPCVDVEDSAKLVDQREAFEAWEQGIRHLSLLDSLLSPVCLELGCEEGSMVRELFASELESSRWRFVRVGCSGRCDDTPNAVTIHMELLAALYELQRLLHSVEHAVFIIQDKNGNGAEVSAPIDARVGHVVKKAIADLSWAFGTTPEEGPLECEAQNVMREFGDAQRLQFHEPVPQKCFVRFARPGYEAPTARLILSGGYFAARSARLEARTDIVERALGELNAEFGRPEYQYLLKGVKDRVTLQAMIREVQLRVMGRQGWPVQGASPNRLHELVLQMKGFNVSAMHGLPHLQRLVDESLARSGVHRLESLPRRVKPVEAA